MNPSITFYCEKKNCYKHNHFRFEEQSRTPNGLYIFFHDSANSCHSGVGKTPLKKDKTKHVIRVGGCKSFGEVAHELMHSLGESYRLHLSKINSPRVILH